MNHLIIYTHLNPESFSKAVADEQRKQYLNTIKELIV
jgi:putative NADPH-quinone reductase